MTAIVAQFGREVTHIPEGWFTADDVQDAYEKGKSKGFEDGKKHHRSGIEKTLMYNLDLATEVAEGVIGNVREQAKIAIQEAFLRIDSLSKFSILYIVAKDDFLSQNMRSAYEIAGKAEEAEGNPFEISFSFYMNSANLSKDNINADGYLLKHVPGKSTKAGAGAA